MKTWTTQNGYKITQLLGGRSNVFLLSNEENNILIDSGPKFMWKKLRDQLRKLNIDKIDYLILTHTHFDHAANSKQLKEKYGAKVIVHKNEEEYLLHGDNVMFSGTNPLSRLLAGLFVKLFTSYARYEACKPDILVDSSFTLNDMGFNGIIIHTPGHSPGSICIIVDDEVALVGDTMFKVFRGSVYPPFAVDTATMINSWGSLLGTNSRVFLPSHGSSNPRSLVERDYKKRSTTGTKA